MDLMSRAGVRESTRVQRRPELRSDMDLLSRAGTRESTRVQRQPGLRSDCNAEVDWKGSHHPNILVRIDGVQWRATLLV